MAEHEQIEFADGAVCTTTCAVGEARETFAAPLKDQTIRRLGKEFHVAVKRNHRREAFRVYRLIMNRAARLCGLSG